MQLCTLTFNICKLYSSIWFSTFFGLHAFEIFATFYAALLHLEKVLQNFCHFVWIPYPCKLPWVCAYSKLRSGLSHMCDQVIIHNICRRNEKGRMIICDQQICGIATYHVVRVIPAWAWPRTGAVFHQRAFCSIYPSPNRCNARVTQGFKQYALGPGVAS